jgi:pSer/pThr/pTyr-binding forkhead associated (FHA) protein/nitrogen-specific signal transduction histidine kinase
MYDVPPEGATIGRDLENLVCLTDLETSRAHCQIVFEEGTIFLIDLKSSNGTTVNGKMVARTPIKVGDHIQLGQTVMIVLAASSIPSADVPPVPKSRSKIASTLTPGPVTAENLEDSDRFVAVMKSNLQFMYNASLATTRQEVGPMLDEVLNLIFEWTDADRACVLLRDGPRKPLQAKAVKHRDPAKKNEKLKVSRSILKHVDDKAEGVISSDLRSGGSIGGSPSVLESGISEVVCVPICGRTYGLGLIYIDKLVESPSEDLSFGEDHLKLLHAIAHQTAVAIENEEYYATILEKERMLAVGETAEKLSHRIKNILQSINGGAFLVEDGLEKSNISTVEKGWEIVKRNQERISRLVLEMMLVNNDYVADMGQFCVVEMLDHLIENQRANAKLLDVEIDYVCGIRPVDVIGDRRSLQDAVEYVIAEAVKNSRSVDDPKVSVRLVSNLEVIEVFVESAEAEVDDKTSESPYKSEIFSAAKEFFPGLELSAAQKILRGHGGNVEIANERTQEKYRIWFPVVLSSDSEVHTIVQQDVRSDSNRA